MSKFILFTSFPFVSGLALWTLPSLTFPTFHCTLGWEIDLRRRRNSAAAPRPVTRWPPRPSPTETETPTSKVSGLAFFLLHGKRLINRKFMIKPEWARRCVQNESINEHNNFPESPFSAVFLNCYRTDIWTQERTYPFIHRYARPHLRFCTPFLASWLVDFDCFSGNFF